MEIGFPVHNEKLVIAVFVSDSYKYKHYKPPVNPCN